MRTMTGPALAAAVAALALAGCSGGSEPMSYDDLVAEHNDLINAVKDEEPTQPADLPDSGSASYEGVVEIETDGVGGAPLYMLGEVGIEVDFGDISDPVSGAMGGFQTPDGAEVEGELQISDSAIDPDADPGTSYTWGAALDGTLVVAGTDYVFGGVAVGDFYGEDHDLTGGEVWGTVLAGNSMGSFDGDFAAAD